MGLLGCWGGWQSAQLTARPAPSPVDGLPRIEAGEVLRCCRINPGFQTSAVMTKLPAGTRIYYK